MKKKLLLLMIGILLIGVNAYAQGDLKVTGNVGVGTDPNSVIKLDVAATGDSARIVATKDDTVNTTNVEGLTVDVTNSATAAGSTLAEFAGNIVATHTGTASSAAGSQFMRGVSMDIQLRGAQSAGSVLVEGLKNQTQIGDTTGNYTNINRMATMMARTVLGGFTTDTHTIGTVAGIYSQMALVGSNTYNVTDMAHVWIEENDASSLPGTQNNYYGIRVGKTSGATNNYGIVLDGDGAGADIVFGPNQQSRIYSQDDAGTNRLYAEDESGNQTIISPHDPETGEWIFYSKNIKTGKTVRVNMEKLVKAVEQLTGETFMIETMEEVK